MRVIRAKVLGFCMGVRRAVELAYGEAERSSLTIDEQSNNSVCRVYTFGPLIHNSRALEALKLSGIELLSDQLLPNDLQGSPIVIRAHGVSPQTEAKLYRYGAAVIDATCPRVKASQLKAEALSEAGYTLFLAGEESHAEITGIRGYAEVGKLRRNAVHYNDLISCTADLFVVGNAYEAEQAAAILYEKAPKNIQTALIGQTTISAEEYNAISEAISRFFPSLEILQTICTATKERQDSLRELINIVDAVIIAGGKNSSNTRRLLHIAEEAGIPCALVETSNDIPQEFFAYQTIGLTAGASTPDFVIDEIEQALKNSFLTNSRAAPNHS